MTEKMHKTITKIILISAFALSLLIVCDCLSSEALDTEEVTETEVIANNAADALAANCEDHEKTEDYTWDSNEVVHIVLNYDTIATDGAGVTIDGGTITITSGGTYVISGNLSDGQIIVDSDDKKTVRLILNGAFVCCSSSAAMLIENAKKTVIVLAENTVNYFCDERPEDYEGPLENEPNAAIFSRDDLTICGDGSLAVDGNVNDGIAGKDGLIIAGGIIDVNAIDDGIRGKDYLVIHDAKIIVNSGGDGLKSDNDQDAEKGYIYIASGVIDVNSAGDAITAQTDAIISDGQIDLFSGEGYAGGIDENTSAKGIKAGIGLIIDGGIFSIDSTDDALHSDGNVAINGGTFIISSKDDAISSDSAIEINGGEITITKCYEGIDSPTVTINDGDIYILSNDDGIIATEHAVIEYGIFEINSGSDAISAGIDVIITDGQFTIDTGSGRNRSTTSTSAKGIKAVENLIVDGGNFLIDSVDDAVHSDGNLEINGGTFSIIARDDGIHANNDVVINGGDIDIIESYEGIESADANITINGGSIHIVSSDDGINVAGGGDNFGPGGPGRGGTPTTPTTNGNCFLYINGGYIVIDADGDGLDSNGSIEMTDGVVIVNGPTNDMNGALDHSSFKITGGLLIAAGSSGMAQAPDDTTSSQYSVLLTFNKTMSGGTMIHIQNKTGGNILSFVPTKTYRSLAFSSQELTKGSTYDVYYGGTSTGTVDDGLYEDGTYTPGTIYTSFTISSITTNIR